MRKVYHWGSFRHQNVSEKNWGPREKIHADLTKDSGVRGLNKYFNELFIFTKCFTRFICYH